ncbi:hypothetical protein AAA569_35865, partial [Pseudomonas aeruginosa]
LVQLASGQDLVPKTSDSSPSSLTMKAPNPGRFFHFMGIDIHFSPAHPLPRELLTLSATLPPVVMI